MRKTDKFFPSSTLRSDEASLSTSFVSGAMPRSSSVESSLYWCKPIRSLSSAGLPSGPCRARAHLPYSLLIISTTVINFGIVTVVVDSFCFFFGGSEISSFLELVSSIAGSAADSEVSFDFDFAFEGWLSFRGGSVWRTNGRSGFSYSSHTQ